MKVPSILKNIRIVGCGPVQATHVNNVTSEGDAEQDQKTREIWAEGGGRGVRVVGGTFANVVPLPKTYDPQTHDNNKA